MSEHSAGMKSEQKLGYGENQECLTTLKFVTTLRRKATKLTLFFQLEVPQIRSAAYHQTTTNHGRFGGCSLLETFHVVFKVWNTILYCIYVRLFHAESVREFARRERSEGMLRSV